MAEKALTAVQNGEMKIVPQRFDKIWYNWLTDIRDWCVSRYVEPLKPSFAFLLYPP
jgi:valyl-tRNA synthetase